MAMLRRSIFVAFLAGVISTLGCAEECSLSSTAHEQFGPSGDDTLVFDNEGNIQSIESDLNDDGIVDERSTYTYGDDGLLATIETRDNNDNIVRQTTFTHNSDGNVLNIEARDADGVLLYRQTYSYTYDKNGAIFTQEIRDAEGNVINVHTFSYTYDEHGNILTENRTSSNPDWGDELTTYTYDEHGNRLTRVNALGKTTYTYTCG